MRVWIDIDNSPHVPFFKPIVRAMQERGDEVLLTTRRYAQTLELLSATGFDFTVVGAHAGASRVKKVANLIHRSWQLRSVVKRFSPDVALSHGSRALSLTARMMSIPNLLLFDYEWTEMHIFTRCADLMACPVVLPHEALERAGIPLDKLRRYTGFKEELYLPSFVPDPSFRASLDIPDEAVLVTIRPSSMTSNYHDSRSEDILRALIERMGNEPSVIALVTPRTDTDKEFVRAIVEQRGFHNIRISERALDGMQLLYWSDAVVSGGGTMNRESALLGTQTVSMFTGTRPSIDEYLASKGLLRFVEKPDDIATLSFERRRRTSAFTYSNANLTGRILELCDECIDVAEGHRARNKKAPSRDEAVESFQ